MTPEKTMDYINTFHSIPPKELASDKWMGMPGAKDTGVLRTLQSQAEFLEGRRADDDRFRRAGRRTSIRSFLGEDGVSVEQSRHAWRSNPSRSTRRTRRAAAKLLIDGVSKRFGAGRGRGAGVEAHRHRRSAPASFSPSSVPSGLRQEHAAQHRRRLRDADHRRARRSTAKRSRRPVASAAWCSSRARCSPGCRCEDNIAFGPRALGKSVAESREIARALHRAGRPQRLRATAIRTSFPAACSSASASPVRSPTSREVLLMDEPFAALDQQTRELLQEEIRAIWRRTGKTILWITHSIEEALLSGDACRA